VDIFTNHVLEIQENAVGFGKDLFSSILYSLSDTLAHAMNDSFRLDQE
jgi:hypothetical protein